MTRQASHNRRRIDPIRGPVGTCTCGHPQYITPGYARAFANTNFPGRDREIIACGDYYHALIGSLPGKPA